MPEMTDKLRLVNTAVKGVPDETCCNAVEIFAELP